MSSSYEIITEGLVEVFWESMITAFSRPKDSVYHPDAEIDILNPFQLFSNVRMTYSPQLSTGIHQKCSQIHNNSNCSNSKLKNNLA